MFSPSTLNGNLGELFQQLMCAQNILNSFELSLINPKTSYLHAQILRFCQWEPAFMSSHLLIALWERFMNNESWKNVACVFCCFGCGCGCAVCVLFVYLSPL